MSYLSLDPEVKWFGRRPFWLLCIAALVLSVAPSPATTRRSMFRLEPKTARASYQPADKISGQVRAVYTFGKPVFTIAAELAIE